MFLDIKVKKNVWTLWTGRNNSQVKQINLNETKLKERKIVMNFLKIIIVIDKNRKSSMPLKLKFFWNILFCFLTFSYSSIRENRNPTRNEQKRLIMLLLLISSINLLVHLVEIFCSFFNVFLQCTFAVCKFANGKETNDINLHF